MRLTDIAKKYPTDKDFTHNYYNTVYETVFSPVRQSATKLVEVGIGGFWGEVGWVHGNSLKVFRDYFENATIIGLDIQRYDIQELGDRVIVDWIDQSNKDLLISYADKLMNSDIILDDGSHNTRDQQITFAQFMRCLKDKGIYVIEDLHSSIEVHNPEKVRIWGWGDPTKTTTLDMLEHFQNTGKIVSDYITAEEAAELESLIDSVEIFKITETSITSVIRRK
jgi:ubiquinone/menaquinone biosynthesis C-methylase UbiE